MKWVVVEDFVDHLVRDIHAVLSPLSRDREHLTARQNLDMSVLMQRAVHEVLSL